MSFPEYGTAPIKCSRRKCKWRGFETELRYIPVPRPGKLKTEQATCPICGCESYYYMSEREIKAWEQDKGAANANP